MAHLPALIAASATLSHRLEDDPSAYGVSAAFLGAEDDLEKALVSWCGVVGQVMLELANGALSVPMGSGSRATMYYRKYSGSSKEKDDKSPKRSDTAGSSGSSNGHANARPTKGKKGDKSRPTSSGSGSTSGPPTPSFTGSKALTVQDVAIMPSQRVPRYVMLFKGVLSGRLP